MICVLAKIFFSVLNTTHHFSKYCHFGDAVCLLLILEHICIEAYLYI